MYYSPKILGAFVMGICATLSIFWIYRVFLLSESNDKQPITISIIDTSNHSSYPKLTAIELNQNSIEKDQKRIDLIDKRLDDILIFGGIIITLLLAINVSVYIKAEGEVEKYFRQNFKNEEQKIKELLSKVEIMVNKAKTELDLIQKLRDRTEDSQTPIQ